MNLKLPNKTIVQIASFSYVLAILSMAIVFIISVSYQIPIKKITGDPALTFNVNPLIGFVSNVGVLLWCFTAAVCLFSSFLLWFWGQKKESLFLGFSGLITSVLLVDDFFMIHDYIFYSIGLNQYIMYTIYLFIFVTYFLYFKTEILLSKNIFLLVLAFIFLGSSVAMDVLIKGEGITYFLEDSLKFLGITSWLLYYTITSFCTIRNQINS